MRIAIAQIRTDVADFDKTARRMVELSKSAAEQKADLLAFPFASLTGSIIPEYTCQEGYLIDLVDTLRELAKQVACPCIVPVLTEVEGVAYSDAMLLKDGEAVPLRLLKHLSSKDAASRTPGITFEFDGAHMGVAFSYEDIEDLVASNVRIDVLMYLCGYGYAVDDAGSALGSALAENRFRSDAQALDAWFVAVGSLGGYGPQMFTGSSFVITPNGELAAAAPAFEEALFVADVEPNNHERLAEPLEPEVYNRSLHLWEALSMGLHDYVRGVGCADATLVLDGSLESCALAALASDALGPTHVHAVSGAGMSAADAKVAASVARALHIAYAPVNPKGATLSGAQPKAPSADDHDLDQIALAASARATGALPISHLDKTHLALEATWDCCRAAALLPFGDVYRSDVRELAHLRNTISHVIPREPFSVYDVPPVEGIEAVASTPEGQLRHIDVTLTSHVEWEHSLSDVAAGQEHPEVAVSIVRLLHEKEAARACYPSYLVVSSRTLRDMHIPKVISWQDRTRAFSERLTRGRFMDRLNMLVDSKLEPSNPDASDSKEIREALESLGFDITSGNLPEGIDPSEIEGALGSLIGLLQDMFESGGFGTDDTGGVQPPTEGPIGPITWGSPFSEN